MSVVSFSALGSFSFSALGNFSCLAIDELVMNPDAVVAWTSLYFSTSVIWLVISGFLLHGRLHKKHSHFLLPLL